MRIAKSVLARSRTRGQVPLSVAIVLAIIAVIGLAFWTREQTKPVSSDGRQELVFWGNPALGEDIYAVIHRFEEANPQYKVVMSAAAARDLTGDAQRLLTAVAGGVPPDVVYFDRFAIGEWAARGALADLTPMFAAQRADDPYRIDLAQYYEWSVAEASYRPPGSKITPRVFGVPWSADVRLLFCNGDLLLQAGMVDAKGNPRAPQTWDELRAAAGALTIYRSAGDKRSGITRLGFAPSVGNSWLYLYAFQAGGNFLSADGLTVTLNSPPVVRALKFMVDLYDDLGGIGQVDAFQQSQSSGGDLDPFLTGRLAMKIDGDASVARVADFRQDMNLLTAPAPMPADETAKGRGPVAWSGGFAFVVPATSRQREGAFKFIQFLSSWEGTEILERGKREQKQSEGRLYLPEGRANRVNYERLVAENVDANPAVPPAFKQAYRVIRDMMPRTQIRPVTAVGQLLWSQHVRATEAAENHVYDAAVGAESKPGDVDPRAVEHALATMASEVQNQLDSMLGPPPSGVIQWASVFGGYAVLIALVIGTWLAVFLTKRRHKLWRRGEVAAAMMFASPWLIGFVVFVGGPVAFSLVLSLTRYDGLNEARFLATQNFRDVFHDPLFYKSLFNTMFMAAQIPLDMAMSLMIAMLLHNAVRGIGFYRAAFYLPVVMPMVASSLLWIWIFNPNVGILNVAIGWIISTPPAHWMEAGISSLIGETFHFSPPLWLQSADWSKPSLILMNLWKAGGGMLIWLAGLSAIPAELYEAAKVDGAGPWTRFRNVTVPMLSPYILFNLIVGLIGTMQMFGEAYIMTAGGPVDSTLFYAYYLFKQAFQFFRMGYASALAWILFVIVLALTMAQLALSRKWVHYER